VRRVKDVENACGEGQGQRRRATRPALRSRRTRARVCACSILLSLAVSRAESRSFISGICSARTLSFSPFHEYRSRSPCGVVGFSAASIALPRPTRSPARRV
jgi:hypothetical protein